MTHATRDVTPLANISVQLSLWSLEAPGDVAVKINDRNARWHDLYRIELATGQRMLIWENTDELLNVHLDWHLRPRHARSNAPDGGSRLWHIEGTELRPWRDVPYEDSVTTWAGIFNRSNERVLLLTSMGRETAAYSWHDWASGRDTLIAEHPRADCSYLVLHPATYEVDAVGVTATDRSGSTLLLASLPISLCCRGGSRVSSSAFRARRTTIAAGSSWPTRQSNPLPTICSTATSSR